MSLEACWFPLAKKFTFAISSIKRPIHVAAYVPQLAMTVHIKLCMLVSKFQSSQMDHPVPF